MNVKTAWDGKNRKIASNTVILDGDRLGRYVVVLSGDKVEDFFPLKDELPFTEWIMEPIILYTDSFGVVRKK